MSRNIVSMKSLCSYNVCVACGGSVMVSSDIFLGRRSRIKGTYRSLTQLNTKRFHARACRVDSDPT